jgi:LacI family transcriptional regulator
MSDLLAMNTPPDAVFVANNLMSVGALQVLAERGILPPRVGMAIFGDLTFAPLQPTGITVVHLPARHLGVTAARLLLERINGDDQPPRTIVLRNEVNQSAIEAAM